MPYESSTPSTKRAEEFFAGASLTDFTRRLNLDLPPDTPVEFTDPYGTERQADSPVKWSDVPVETSAHPVQLLIGERRLLEVLIALRHDPLRTQKSLYGWLVKTAHLAGVSREQESPRELKIRPVRPPVDLSWFIEAHANNEGASSATLVNIITGIHLLIKNRDFQMIDMVLRTTRLDRLAPEAIVAFARTSFPIRSRLSEWQRYLQRARKELRRRSLNAVSLMSGLA